MEYQRLIKSVERFEKNENNSQFVIDTQYYLKKEKEKNEVFEKIPFEYSVKSGLEYILFALRIHILYTILTEKSSIYQYAVYFSTKKESSTKNIKRVCYRKLELSYDQAYNLLNQIEMITYGTFDHNFDIKPDSIAKQTNGKYIYYLTIGEIHGKINEKLQDDKHIIKDIVLFDILSMLLGIETFKFLEHQNLRRYFDSTMIQKRQSSIAHKELPNYIKIMQTSLSWQERDRYIVMGGVYFHLLGTKVANDIDIEYIGNDITSKTTFSRKHSTKKITKQFYMSKYDIFTVYSNPEQALKCVHFKTTTCSHHNYENNPRSILSLFEKEPKYGNYNLPQDAYLNPKISTYCHGVKMSNMDYNINRYIDRGRPRQFVTLYLLKLFNKINVIDKYCLKRLSYLEGKSNVRLPSSLHPLQKLIQKLLMSDYKVTIPKNILHKIQFCDNNTEYSWNVTNNITSILTEYFAWIFKLHSDIKNKNHLQINDGNTLYDNIHANNKLKQEKIIVIMIDGIALLKRFQQNKYEINYKDFLFFGAFKYEDHLGKIKQNNLQILIKIMFHPNYTNGKLEYIFDPQYIIDKYKYDHNYALTQKKNCGSTDMINGFNNSGNLESSLNLPEHKQVLSLFNLYVFEKMSKNEIKLPSPKK
jgi:hypothetical protein